MQIIALILLTAVLYCCQSATNTVIETNQIDTTKIMVINENTNIDYDLCGEGEITVLLIHGWCIDRSYWSNQIKALCNQYSVVAVDLPGHGSSGKDREHWSIERYGKDVAALIEQLQLDDIILVGHSMGGDIMLETALLQKEKIIGIVGVDNFKQAGSTSDSVNQAEIEGFMQYLRADFKGAVDVFANQFLFSSQTDSISKSRIITSLKSADTVMAVEVLESLFTYSQKEIPQLSAVGQKLFLINSDVTPTVDTHLLEQNIDFEIIDIVGTGHYPMIEKPYEFNRLLLQTLQKIEETKVN